ncbi:uncharacterized protein LOC144428322 [Styela clava]
MTIMQSRMNIMKASGDMMISPLTTTKKWRSEYYLNPSIIQKPKQECWLSTQSSPCILSLFETKHVEYQKIMEKMVSEPIVMTQDQAIVPIMETRSYPNLRSLESLQLEDDILGLSDQKSVHDPKPQAVALPIPNYPEEIFLSYEYCSNVAEILNVMVDELIDECLERARTEEAMEAKLKPMKMENEPINTRRNHRRVHPQQKAKGKKASKFLKCLLFPFARCLGLHRKH